MLSTETLNLSNYIPTHWNRCTASQLETIARVYRTETENVTPFHPFSMYAVKLSLFFLFSKIHILEPLNPRVPVEDQYYLCAHPSIKGPFNLYLWQIDYWINGLADYKREADLAVAQAEREERRKEKEQSKEKNSEQSTSLPLPPTGGGKGGGSGSGSGSGSSIPKKVRGLFDWLDDPKDLGLTLMPYETLKLRKHYDDWRKYLSPLPLTGGLGWVSFQAPSALMQNFSWQQYRFAQDYMDNYILQSNALLKMEQHRIRYSPQDLIKQQQTVDLARALFLATIFDAKIKYIDTDTQKAVHGFHYTSNQSVDNAQYFRRFPEDKWQVILFWWSGMMRYLQRQYPHVFTKTPSLRGRAGKRHNPLEVYTATITTLEKYLHQTEDELNRQSFTLTLETLERMSKENEELERMRSKHK